MPRVGCQERSWDETVYADAEGHALNQPLTDLRDPEIDGPGNLPSSKTPQGSSMPAWLNDARWYYSLIGPESALPVSVFDATDCDEVSEESPGTLCLRLEPQYRYSPRVRVLDAGGREVGTIRPAGLVPGVRYVMSRNGNPVWTLSVRSIVRKRHALVMVDGDGWAFYTPFIWWYGLMGTILGVPSLLGTVGPNWWGVWQMWIEPGRDTSDLLAAIAFMHRQWSRM